jgi:chromosomal replication initiation ATPase DnaA
MPRPDEELSIEMLEGMAQTVGLTLEQERLQEILVKMRSMLQQLYMVSEEALRDVEPFHILPLPNKG